MNDMRELGMVNIHGRANYQCPVYGNCDDGSDQKHKCSRLGSSGCAYSCAVDTARRSNLLVTNYAYWLRARAVSSSALESDESIGLLICDEAHTIERQLTDFLSITVNHRFLGNRWKFDNSGRIDSDNNQWAGWSEWTINKYGDSNDDELIDLCADCRKIARMSGNWVWQFGYNGSVTFAPVHISSYMTKLFSGVPKVLLMSASLDEFTLKMLMPPEIPFSYKAFPYQFPTGNGPVYHVPTVRLSRKSTDEDYAQVIRTADSIIDSRNDRKGIIHTVSYDRAKQALLHSRHAQRFIWNKSASDLGGCLERFKASTSGVILVTPSVEEGFDFPGDQCQYQILVKFPFPNEANIVTRERCASIRGYRLHYAAQKVNQIKGRPLRSETDRAELFILDNACRQLLGPEGRSYSAPGFRMFTVTQIPIAPPRTN
jgi:Rad3-related DNA helicase